jgi:hypothetical protein
VTAPSFFTRFGALDDLGSAKLASPAATTGVVTIEPRDLLLIRYFSPGCGAGDIISFRFNRDSGNNYQTSFVSATAAAPPVPTNVFNGTTALLRLAGVSLATGRSGLAIISNLATQIKIVKLAVFDIGAAVGTQSVHELGGGGGWFNTTDQITEIEMLTAGGATMNAGSGFDVFGVNY